MDISSITKLGLDYREAKIYLACLELGPLKAKEIALHTGINRVTVYDTAKALFKKGLLSSTQKGKVTYFITHSPDSFIESMKSRLELAKQLLPEIELLLGSTSYRPNLRFFEGQEGIKTVYEETLKCKEKTILCYCSTKDMLDAVGVEFMREYVKRRARRHIVMRAINDPTGEVDDAKIKHSTHTDSALRRQTRISPPNLKFPGMVMMYDNATVLMSTKRENFGFVIESKEFTAMMKQLFEVVWSISTDDKEYYNEKFRARSVLR